MPLLTITNLTPSIVVIQEPTGVYGFVLTLASNGSIVDKALSLNALASIEPLLKAAEARGQITWTVTDDPSSVADLGGPVAAYAAVDVVKYVRLGGNDETGDGSLTHPFATIERGIRAFDPMVPPGVIYRLDATGVGLQTLPEMYEFPVFTGAEGIGDFDFSQRFFHYYNVVNIQADPQLATGVAGITTIPGTATTSTPKANTSLKRITSAAAGWTPGQLKGKFAIGAGLATEHSVIWDNGADWIDITATVVPTFPVTIMECSAELQAAKDSADLHRAAVNIKNTPVALLGIKVRSTSAAAGPLGGWGLQTAGPLPISLQLCHIDGAGFVTTEWTRARQCYLPNALFLCAPNLLTQCYVHRSMEVVPTGPRVTVWGARGVDLLFRKTVIEGCATIRFRDLFDTHLSGPVPMVLFNNCQILDPLDDFPPVLGTVQDGIYWTGSQLRLIGVDITRTAGDPSLNLGNAIRCKGNGAYVLLQSVTETGFDLGVLAENGGYVEVDDAGGSASVMTGTTGAFKSGSLAVAATLPAANYPAAGSAFPDFLDALVSQGTRVWRTS